MCPYLQFLDYSNVTLVLKAFYYQKCHTFISHKYIFSRKHQSFIEMETIKVYIFNYIIPTRFKYFSSQFCIFSCYFQCVALYLELDVLNMSQSLNNLKKALKMRNVDLQLIKEMVFAMMTITVKPVVLMMEIVVEMF